MHKFWKVIYSSEILRVITNISFLNFMLSVVFSQIAINLMNVVLIFLIFYLKPSNFLVSLLILTFIIPQILLSFVGGVLADIKNKKKILLYGNLVRAAILLLLFFNTNSILLVYVVSSVVSIVTQFYIPAETPIIPKLVDKKNLTAANSLFGVALFGSVLISYIIAGPLLKYLGRSWIFVAMSGVFVLASFFIYLLPEKIFESKGTAIKNAVFHIQSSILDELKKTYSMLTSTRGVLVSLFLLSSSQIIVLTLATVIPGYAQEILEVPSEDLSLLIFSPAALGMIIASLLVGSTWYHTSKRKLMTIGLFISALVLCLFPFTNRIVTRQIVFALNTFLPNIFEITKIHFAVFLSFSAGFSNALIFIPSQTIIQERIPEAFRSRVYGLLFGVVGIFSLLPVLLTGGIADEFGVGTVLFIMGAIIFLIATGRALPLSRWLRKYT